MPIDQKVAFDLEQFKAQQKGLFIEHFPNNLDDTSMVLKAHLLLEAAFRDFIARSVPKPHHLKDASFRYEQIMCLAKALCGYTLEDLSDTAWVIAKHLGGLRNKMAHELTPDPVKIENHQREIINLVKKHTPPELQETIDLKASLAFTLGIFHSFFGMVLTEEERSKSDSGKASKSPPPL